MQPCGRHDVALAERDVYKRQGNKEDAELFGRNIPKQAVNKSVAVVSMFFIIASLSTILLSVVTDADVIDIVYETVSATATVGLSRNLTSMLNLWGKLIIIVTMYLGKMCIRDRPDTYQPQSIHPGSSHADQQ